MAASSKSSSSTLASKKKQQQPHHQYPKTLPSLFRHFVGIPLSVELKTGRLYQGILAESDDFGNLTLENAQDISHGRRSDNAKQDAVSSMTPTPPPPIQFASLHLRGPTIRYIHFPPDVELSALIRKGMDRERSAAQTYARGKRS